MGGSGWDPVCPVYLFPLELLGRWEGRKSVRGYSFSVLFIKGRMDGWMSGWTDGRINVPTGPSCC